MSTRGNFLPTAALILLSTAFLFKWNGLKTDAHVITEVGSSSPVSDSSVQQTSTAPTETEKTVEQTRKNIKVLTGLPDWQLIPVMTFMSSSLGVKCNYCHVNKGNDWNFESDDKPEKQTGREMIRMVLNVNKVTFRGNTEVSCFTCHRGHTGPVSVPILPITEASQRSSESSGANLVGQAGQGGQTSQTGAGGTSSSSASPAQPSADEILNKYIAAVGGQAAIDKLRTRVVKGTSVNANGQAMAYELYQVAPDKFYVSLSTPRGAMERGFNGSVGWEKNPAGMREITGQQLTQLKQRYQLFADLRLKDDFTRMTVARDRIDTHDVYVIRAGGPNKRRERLYFDVDSGLLVRRITFMETPVGVIPQQFDFEDYREIDGLKVPFTVRVLALDSFSSATQKFSEVKLNGPVDGVRFDRPKTK